MPQLKSEESLKKGAGLDEIQQRVQKLLFPGHTCRVALEVKKNQAGGSNRVLSIVSPAEGKSHTESCVFILGKTKLFSSNLQVCVCLCLSPSVSASLSLPFLEGISTIDPGTYGTDGLWASFRLGPVPSSQREFPCIHRSDRTARPCTTVYFKPTTDAE